MGFEIKYKFHPRKQEGGYDTDKLEEKTAKVGKPFDDTPLEKCAAAIMGQLARRDIWVVDVEVYEVVKKKISFKESNDGKGILLKNKRFSLNSTAQMVAEDVVDETAPQQQALVPQPPTQMAIPQQLPPGMQPHQLIQRPQQAQMVDTLYANPNAAAIQHLPPPPINQKRVLYEVYFEPAIVYVPELKKMKLKFTRDKKYPVHEVIPSPTGSLAAQRIAVTDDTGKVITVDEKYFSSAGRGLLADKELNFSGGNGRGEQKPKLMYDDQMVADAPIHRGKMPQGIPEEYKDIPLDDGTIPESYFNVPEIRPGSKLM